MFLPPKTYPETQLTSRFKLVAINCLNLPVSRQVPIHARKCTNRGQEYIT